jgi:hypothetical protein
VVKEGQILNFVSGYRRFVANDKENSGVSGSGSRSKRELCL